MLNDKNSNLKRDLDTYFVKVSVSHKKYVIVEGNDDRNALDLLCQEIFSDDPVYMTYFNFELVDMIEDNRLFGLGQREKIEKICEYFFSKKLGDKLIGFVDREYRLFFENNKIIDKISGHFCIDNLVWTQGHSIENYLFDPKILIRAYQINIKKNKIEKKVVNEVFLKYFDSVLMISCALGLTVKSVKLKVKWAKIFNSLTVDLLQFYVKGQRIRINKYKWIKILKNWKIIENDVELLIFIAEFNTWISKLKTCNKKTILWLCHGHLGIKLLWCLYHKCFIGLLKELPSDQYDLKKIGSYLSLNRIDETLLTAMQIWASFAKYNSVVYPNKLIELIKA